MLCLASCNTVDAEGLWENATYRRDMTFGEGEKTVFVEVKVAAESITFTINTDEKYLGDALIAHELIDGEEGPYGLYVKVVNGITADYDVDQSYWALSKDGEMCMSGVDTTEIADGEHYELVYTK
jgi:D-arabinose 1-dehydrogenase-like Zn-dependent alcohol dehydrogenase